MHDRNPSHLTRHGADPALAPDVRVRARTDAPPAAFEVQLRWERPTLVGTGPGTFYLTIPIIGAAPEVRDVREFLGELQRLWSGAPRSPGGTGVRAVRGSVSRTSGSAHLSLYVTMSRPSGPPYDAQYIDSLIEFAARCLDPATAGSASAGRTLTERVDSAMSDLQRRAGGRKSPSMLAF